MKSTMSMILVSAFALSACTTSVEFSKTGTMTPSSMDKNCEFTVYEDTPSIEFQEVGKIKLIDNPACLPKTASDVVGLVKTEVCKNGGNGFILGAVNEKGTYDQGTVISTK